MWVDRFIADGPAGYTLVKFFRDPVDRCISSFRHALRTGYADEHMAQILQMPIDHRVGFSLRTFLRYLSKVDLFTADVHHKLQHNSIDLQKFGRVIFIEVSRNGLYRSLETLEEQFDLKTTNFVENEDFERIARTHHAKDAGNAISEGDIIDINLTKYDAATNWPKQLLVRCDFAQEQIKNLYLPDYELGHRLADISLVSNTRGQKNLPVAPGRSAISRVGSTLNRIARWGYFMGRDFTDFALVSLGFSARRSVFHYYRAGSLAKRNQLEDAVNTGANFHHSPA